MKEVIVKQFDDGSFACRVSGDTSVKTAAANDAQGLLDIINELSAGDADSGAAGAACGTGAEQDPTGDVSDNPNIDKASSDEAADKIREAQESGKGTEAEPAVAQPTEETTEAKNVVAPSETVAEAAPAEVAAESAPAPSESVPETVAAPAEAMAETVSDSVPTDDGLIPESETT